MTVLRTSLSLLSKDYFPHWKLEIAIIYREWAQNDTSTWYLTAHYRLISWRRRWGYQVSSYSIANLQIHGIAMSQTPSILEVLSQVTSVIYFWRIHGSPAMWGDWVTYYPLPSATTIWMLSTYWRNIHPSPFTLFYFRHQNGTISLNRYDRL